MTVEQLREMTETAIQAPGVCAGLATANTMHVLAEARGMTLPGNAPVRAGSEKMFEVDLAVGGSVNSVRHLAAVATEAELNVDVISLFEERAQDASLVCRIRPNGPHSVGELEEAGGARGAMKQISSRLDTSAITVSGKTV